MQVCGRKINTGTDLGMADVAYNVKGRMRCMKYLFEKRNHVISGGHKRGKWECVGGRQIIKSRGRLSQPDAKVVGCYPVAAPFPAWAWRTLPFDLECVLYEMISGTGTRAAILSGTTRLLILLHKDGLTGRALRGGGGTRS